MADRFWRAMLAYFGPMWHDSYGEAPTRDWIYMFDSLDERQIRRGLRAIVNNGLHFPPSLPEVAGWCQESAQEPSHKLLDKPPMPPRGHPSLMSVDDIRDLREAVFGK